MSLAAVMGNSIRRPQKDLATPRINSGEVRYNLLVQKAIAQILGGKPWEHILKSCSGNNRERFVAEMQRYVRILKPGT